VAATCGAANRAKRRLPTRGRNMMLGGGGGCLDLQGEAATWTKHTTNWESFGPRWHCQRSYWGIALGIG
jgi:hypothetical protein